MALATLKSTRDFVRIWFYWKIPAISLFCLIFISICLYSFTQTPIYESTAKILLLPTTNDGLVVSAGQGNRQYDIQPVDSYDINTEIELIQSNKVLKRTMAFFEKERSLPQEAPPKKSFFDRFKFVGKTEIETGQTTKKIFESMDVEHIVSSNMIMVSLGSINQNQVADVLNKLLEVYVQFHKSMYSFEESEEFYDEQKNHYAKKLKEARDKLSLYNNSNSIANMDSQIQANINLFSAFNSQFQNLEVAIAENDARMDMLEKGLNVKGNMITISKEMRSMPVIVELAKGIVPLLIKRTEISKTFTKGSREYKQIDSQIAMLREEIKKESLTAARTDQMESTSLKVKRDALERRLAHLKDQIKHFQQKKQKLNALELDVEIAQKNYLLYGSKSADSRLYSKRDQSNLSNVVVVESGLTPTKPKSPNKLLALQVALFLGLMAAFILPFLLETIDHKLKTADDIENVLSLPVVCTYNEL
jgi:protein tyrosine kinase modulator